MDAEPEADDRTTPEQREIEATRERLVDVTIELLNERGNHSLRLADVARATGVAVSTIYAHFRDRTDLVAAARLKQFKAHADESLRMVESSLADPEIPPDIEDTAFWPSLRAPDEEGSRVRRWDRIEAIADARHIPALRAQIEELQSNLTGQAADLTRRAQALGMVDPSLDPAAIAMFTQVLRLGLALWDIAGDTRPDTAAWGELLDRIGAVFLVDPSERQSE